MHSLGRHQEAEAVYRKVLEGKVVPWAKMGLAMALKERGALDEAEKLAEQVTQEAPEFLSAYDFLASVHEAQGKLEESQKALQRAADISPNNTVRQRLVGDIAARNKDLLSAEKAYGKVLERHRGSSLKTVDDFTNLSRVLVERGDTTASRKIVSEMKREWRGDKRGRSGQHGHGKPLPAAGGRDRQGATTGRPGTDDASGNRCRCRRVR